MTSILIVDDDRQIRWLIRQYIEDAGYTCHLAEDVPAARQVLASHPVDLILSDLDMPGESGYDLIRYVNDQYPGTPMIIVSVIDNPDAARKALAAGVFGYIVKPFSRNIVLINVENALRRGQLERENKNHLDRLETLVRQRTEILNDQLAFMEGLIDAIPSPVFYKDTRGVILGCNSAFETLSGGSRSAVIGKTADQAVPELQADLCAETDRRLLGSPGRLTYAFDITRPGHAPQQFLMNKATFLAADGSVAGLVGVMVDVSELAAAEDAVRMSEEKFRRIVENIGIGVALISPAMEVLWMNSQMVEWFPDVNAGTHPICHHAFIIPPRETTCNNCPTVRALKEGRRFEATSTAPMTVRDRHFRIIASPIHDRDGKVIAAIELVDDITEKLTQERELRQAQKLEAIGQLAAGIAHEINTPIQYVGDNTRFLEEAFEDLHGAMAAYARLLAEAKTGTVTGAMIADVDAAVDNADIPYLATEIPSAIEQSLEGVHRVAKIVRAMRAFSHPGNSRKEEVDLNQALESTITVARSEWKYVADLETDLDPDLPAIPCFPAEMNQVFLNLLVNAAHAVGDATDDGKKGKGSIRITTRLMDQMAQIRIADSGDGIPSEIRQRIFDPFFTTKTVGKGTGQGLAIARNVVVDKHGGTLRFDTECGQGTTFIIELPISYSSPAAASDRRPADG